MNIYLTRPRQLLDEAFKSLVGMRPKIKMTDHSLHNLLVCRRQAQIICFNQQFPYNIYFKNNNMLASASTVGHVTGQPPPPLDGGGGRPAQSQPKLYNFGKPCMYIIIV